MAALSEQKKQELIAKLERLNSNFSDKAFSVLYDEFKMLSGNVLFLELEVWLLALIEKMDLFIVRGVLAGLYYEIHDFPKAKEFAVLADEKFPGSKIWSDIIASSIWGEFMEEDESDQTLPS